MARTKDFAKVIRDRLASDPDLAEAVEAESFNADVAMKVYEARTEAGLTQKQLAERVGTQQSVISRIEDADYDGHSLSSLRRIGRALGKKLRLEFYACQASSSNDVTQKFSLNWPSTADWPLEIREAKCDEKSTRFVR